MRTNKFLTYLCSSLGLLSFSSCLSNGDNTKSINADIAYITNKSNTKVAATAYNGYVSSSVIRGMSLGEFYSVGYKVSGVADNGVYIATDFMKHSDTPLPQTSLISSSVPENVMLPLTGVQTPIFSTSEDYWEDRWVFAYSVTVGEKENPVMYFYYDEDNQVDNSGKDISADNKIIIDLHVTKDLVSESGTSTNKVITTVGNLSALRSASSGFVPDYSKSNKLIEGKKYVEVLVQFRFSFLRKGQESSTPEIAYIGSWENDTAFRMIFIQE